MSNTSKIRYINQLLVSKEASCKEITNKYLESIEKYNKTLNAYVTVTPEEALKAAEKVDEKIASNEEISLLEGIPMTLKDNICTKGIITTCCSKMLENYEPIYNATVWEVLKETNAILLGKTNMDEFAMGSTCETSFFGGALNPHNTNYVAGGSSGGGASAVSGNIAVYALGSDTGGSIRQPASFCGMVGLKPTYGAVSRYGLVAFASSLDQIGPIAPTVEDTAIVYDAISGYDYKDSTSQGKKGESTAKSLKSNINGMRIGVVKEFLDYTNDEIKNSIDQAIKVYESLGAKIVNVNIESIKHALPVYYILACAEASSNLGRYDGIRYGYRTESYNDINEMICKTRSEGFGREVKHRILLGTYVLSSGYYDAYYKKAQNLRGTIVTAFKKAFECCDVIIAPTTPRTAFKRNYILDDSLEAYASDICTVPVNIAGLPALSIPCGVDKDGLPIGMQLIGNKFCEGTILNAAYAYENLTRNNLFKSSMGVTL